MASVTTAVRQQLLLWVGVVAVSLSLLAMHQLSLDHTAAGPLPVVEASDSISQSWAVSDRGHGVQHLLPGVDHPAEAAASSTPHDACPGCSQHAMVLTCLVALVLLVTGWLLRGPPTSHPVPATHRRDRVGVAVTRWTPPPRTWIELSVCRT